MRNIKPEEQELTYFLLKMANKHNYFEISSKVEEYGEVNMGSINFNNANVANYAGDIVQAEFIDGDGVRVVITLTKDCNENLLDMDFWKEDFSNLINYPTPDMLKLSIQ